MRSRKTTAARGRAGQIGRLLCGAQLSKRSSRGEKGRKRKGASRPKSPSPWVLDGFAKGVLVFRGLSGGKGKDKRRRSTEGRGEREVDMQRISGKRIWAQGLEIGESGSLGLGSSGVVPTGQGAVQFDDPALCLPLSLGGWTAAKGPLTGL